MHHTGAVYLADAWLDEAASLADVLLPVTRRSPPPQWFATVDGDDGTGTQYLANLLWVRPRGAAATISAGSPSWRYGTKPFNGSAGACAAFILTGDVLRFDNVDFGAGATALDFSAAAGPGAGAALEVRVGDRWGALLGSGNVPSTGDWEAWQNFSVPITPTAGPQNISLVFLAPGYAAGSTTIYAQFGAQADPNAGSIEVNVRQTVLYPAEPYVDYVTVRGFTLERAATQWAPPSSEQVGIVGPHWSRGWVIEENEVRYATCSCISLGKYGDGTDNTNDKGQADPYTACVYRALENGWHKDRVGSHVVRNNHVHHCGQTGVVGSLGGAFSVITGNSIHDCFENRTFNGAEMAGIKLHGAVDVVIADNHIYNSGNFGIWLDVRTNAHHASPDRCIRSCDSATLTTPKPPTQPRTHGPNQTVDGAGNNGSREPLSRQQKRRPLHRGRPRADDDWEQHHAVGPEGKFRWRRVPAQHGRR